MELARTARRRLIILLLVIAGWVAVVVMRLAALQIVNFDKLSALAARQQSAVVELTGARGAILDRDGRPLALSRMLKSFYAVPSEIENPAQAARALARLLKIDRGRLEKRFGDEKHDFVWVKRRLDDDEARAVEALGLAGIASIEEPGRVYPQGPLGAHVVGYVGVDNQGLAGVEHRYEEAIRGRPGRRVTLRDARGLRFYPEAEGQPALPGQTAILTLDSVIQHLVDRELSVGLERSGGKAGVAVVLDPATGEVLAMSSFPGFDPNAYGRFGQSYRRNNAITNAFEPGSTFKMVTFAGALEGGLIRPGEIVDCGRGGLLVAGRLIRDHKSFDMLTPLEILAQSSNVGSMVIGRRMTPEAFHSTIVRFGFGSPTDIDLPGEERGLVRPPAQWSGRSQATLSIGQELNVTAIQLARAFAAVANGGVAMKPFVVKRLVATDGRVVYERAPEPAGRAVSEATAARLVEMMGEVIRSGTGKQAALVGFSVAGKTGTAQKTGPGGGYVGGHYVASFVGFAPADRPRVVLLVAIDEPKGLTHGGDVAAPIFAAVVQPVLAHLAVPSEDPARVIALELRDYFPQPAIAPDSAEGRAAERTGELLARRWFTPPEVGTP